MTRALRIALGTLVATAIALGAALLSAWPAYRSIPEGTGVLKLSFTHGAAKNCRELTEEELARLPANMRRKTVCERRRPPLFVELDLDGETRIRAELPPTGVAGDGPSRIYESIVLPEGTYEVAVRLRDTARAEGFDHEGAARLVMTPDFNAVIDFRAERGGFVFYFQPPAGG